MFIFKKQPKLDPDPFAWLDRAITLLPEFYRVEPAFSACLGLLAKRDLRAVESLIALTQVDGHYFSDQFWTELSGCAARLNLPVQAAYCEQQMEKNAQELHQKLQPGWTTFKSGPSTYSVHIAQFIREGWNEARRTKHKVPKLLKKNGFHLVQDGRAGMLYYVKEGRLMEIDVEASGSPAYDILIAFDGVTHYALPKPVRLTEEERERLKTELSAWLNKQGLRAHLG